MKKKLLTLTFTLVLLIGLVAAVGMNASAADVTCTANGNIYEVNHGDYLRYYLFNADDGDTIRLTDDIVFQNASGNFEIEPMFNSSKGGNVILDLNGYGLYVAPQNSYLFDLAEVSNVSLHIVDTDPQYEGWIEFFPKQAGSSVFYLGSSNNKLYIYEGVRVTMGKKDSSVTGSQATYIINASSYGEIGIHGAYLENLFISGEGLYFNNNTIGMRNSKVYIDGGTKIKTNSSCIDLHNSPYYPDFQIGAAILDGNNAVQVIEDNKYANTTETALKFKDLLQDGYNLYMVDGTGSDYMNNATLLYNNDTADCYIYKPGYSNPCTTHANKKDIFVHAGGHLTQCTVCGYSAGTTLHTQVTVKEATCTSKGYSKAGYDCACGRLTATVIPALGHDFYTVKAKEPTCTESGTTSDYQKCTRCAGSFTMGGNALGGAKWAAIYRTALGHDMVKVDAKDATCTKDGNIAHYDCSRCDLITSDAEGKKAITSAVVKGGHELVYFKLNPATYVKGGDGEIAHYACSKCDSTFLDSAGKKPSDDIHIFAVDYIALSKTAYTYNGKVQTPSVTVEDTAGDTLKKDTDYTVKYESGRKAPGKYTVTITFKGKYEGTKKLTYTIAPKKVTKLSASQTTTTITLKWSKVTGADAYRVYKYNSKTKKYEKLKDVTSTSLKIKDLKAGTAYKYKVRAITKDDGSIYGAYSDVFATATKTKTPSISSVYSKTKGKAVVKWNNVSGESGFQLYYASSKDGTYKKVKSYEANKLAGSKSKLKSGKKYYFKVRAYKKTSSGTVYSSWSSVKSVKIK